MSENINYKEELSQKENNTKNEMFNEQGLMIKENENKNEKMINDEYYKNEEHPIFNIGKNIIYNNKYIFGIPDHLYEMISLILIFLFIYILFIIFIFPYFYYNKSFIFYSLLFIIITSSFMLGKYNQLSCFFIEPGIIPRQFPKYLSNNLSDKYIYSKITNKPIIMIQRNCKICSIKRPKKCQHCHFCDNCIEEFDHHCQYISNCVGKRNKKNFFLFIFFDLIFLMQIYSFSFIQFYFSFLGNSNEIILIYKYISITIIFLGIIFVLILFNFYFNFINKNILSYILFCFNIIFIISFYFAKNILNNSLPIYVSPFNIVLINIPFNWIYYFFIQFIHQINMIGLNMTSSEYRNLLNYMKIINKDQSYSKLPNDNNNINNNDILKNVNIPCTVIKDLPSKKHIPKFKNNDFVKNLKNLILKNNEHSLLYQEINYY